MRDDEQMFGMVLVETTKQWGKVNATELGSSLLGDFLGISRTRDFLGLVLKFTVIVAAVRSDLCMHLY